MAWHGSAQLGTVWLGTFCQGLAQLSKIWHCVSCLGMIQLSTAQLLMAWCSLTQQLLAQFSTDPASPSCFLTPDPIPCPTAPCSHSMPSLSHIPAYPSAIPLPQPHQQILVPSCPTTSLLPDPALPPPYSLHTLSPAAAGHLSHPAESP